MASGRGRGGVHCRTYLNRLGRRKSALCFRQFRVMEKPYTDHTDYAEGHGFLS